MSAFDLCLSGGIFLSHPQLFVFINIICIYFVCFYLFRFSNQNNSIHYSRNFSFYVLFISLFQINVNNIFVICMFSIFCFLNLYLFILNTKNRADARPQKDPVFHLSASIVNILSLIVPLAVFLMLQFPHPFPLPSFAAPRS